MNIYFYGNFAPKFCPIPQGKTQYNLLLLGEYKDAFLRNQEEELGRIPKVS
jgi:hypothetical protein